MPLLQVVAPEGLAALVEEYASGDRRGVSSRFLGVLRDSADSAATGSDASGPAAASMKGGGSSSAASDLVPLYQQLYAVAVVQSLCTCLEAPEAAAAAQLASLHPGGSVLSAEGYSQLEQVLAGAAEGAAGSEIELEHRLSQQVRMCGGMAGKTGNCRWACPCQPCSSALCAALHCSSRL